MLITPKFKVRKIGKRVGALSKRRMGFKAVEILIFYSFDEDVLHCLRSECSQLPRVPMARIYLF